MNQTQKTSTNNLKTELNNTLKKVRSASSFNDFKTKQVLKGKVQNPSSTARPSSSTEHAPMKKPTIKTSKMKNILSRNGSLGNTIIDSTKSRNSPITVAKITSDIHMQILRQSEKQKSKRMNIILPQNTVGPERDHAINQVKKI